MEPGTTHIHHIGITAPAEILEEVMDFYGKVLALKSGYRPAFGGFGGYWLYAGDQPIVHLLEDANRAGDKSGHFDHVAFRCQNLQAVISRLKANAIPFVQLDMAELNQVQLFLTDPSGTSVELNFEGE